MDITCLRREVLKLCLLQQWPAHTMSISAVHHPLLSQRIGILECQKKKKKKYTNSLLPSNILLMISVLLFCFCFTVCCVPKGGSSAYLQCEIFYTYVDMNPWLMGKELTAIWVEMCIVLLRMRLRKCWPWGNTNEIALTCMFQDAKNSQGGGVGRTWFWCTVEFGSCSVFFFFFTWVLYCLYHNSPLDWTE